MGDGEIRFDEKIAPMINDFQKSEQGLAGGFGISTKSGLPSAKRFIEIAEELYSVIQSYTALIQTDVERINKFIDDMKAADAN